MTLWRDDDVQNSLTALLGSGGSGASGDAKIEASWRSDACHNADALCLAFLPPATVVSGGEDGELLVWELDTSSLNSASDGGGSAAAAAAAEGMRAYGSLRRRVKPPPGVGGAGSATPRLPQERTRAVEALVSARPRAALAPLAAGYADGTICVWDGILQGAPFVELQAAAGHCDDDALCGLATDEANSVLISADAGGTVKVWRTAPLGRRLRAAVAAAELGAVARAARAARARAAVGGRGAAAGSDQATVA